jgi:hypothetical protein
LATWSGVRPGAWRSCCCRPHPSRLVPPAPRNPGAGDVPAPPGSGRIPSAGRPEDDTVMSRHHPPTASQPSCAVTNRRTAAPTPRAITATRASDLLTHLRPSTSTCSALPAGPPGSASRRPSLRLFGRSDAGCLPAEHPRRDTPRCPVGARQTTASMAAIVRPAAAVIDCDDGVVRPAGRVRRRGASFRHPGRAYPRRSPGHWRVNTRSADRPYRPPRRWPRGRSPVGCTDTRRLGARSPPRQLDQRRTDPTWQPHGVRVPSSP